MAKLAIKGHAIRGNEVVEILEMLGGANLYNKSCSDSNLFCYLSNEKRICELPISESYRELTLFTLEEFLEKFPYKIGDKVLRKPYVGARQICEMRWDSDGNCIKYGIGVGEWFNVSQVQPYKEETMEETIIDTIKESADRYRIKVNYQFDIEVDEGEYYAVRRKPQYPKTYEECCKVLNIPSNGNIAYVGDWVYGGEYLEKHLDRLRKFQQLLICRDAYWKMAGDQMGLGKPWEPRCDDGYQRKWIIFCQNGINFTNCFKGHFVLAFPTPEIRDTFYENFKDLIEQCKELL